MPKELTSDQLIVNETAEAVSLSVQEVVNKVLKELQGVKRGFAITKSEIQNQYAIETSTLNRVVAKLKGQERIEFNEARESFKYRPKYQNIVNKKSMKEVIRNLSDGVTPSGAIESDVLDAYDKAAADLKTLLDQKYFFRIKVKDSVKKTNKGKSNQNSRMIDDDDSDEEADDPQNYKVYYNFKRSALLKGELIPKIVETWNEISKDKITEEQLESELRQLGQNIPDAQLTQVKELEYHKIRMADEKKREEEEMAKGKRRKRRTK